MASNAGPKNAVPPPYNVPSTITCQRRSAPTTERTPRAAMATPRRTSAATITRRRSNRSLATPPRSRNTTYGREMATPTAERAVGTFDSWYTCHASATRNTPSPSSDAAIPAHNSRKSRIRNGSSIRGRSGRRSPGGDGMAGVSAQGEQVGVFAHAEPTGQILQDRDEMIDLFVAVRRRGLDPEPDLVLGDQRVGRHRHVDA